MCRTFFLQLTTPANCVTYIQDTFKGQETLLRFLLYICYFYFSSYGSMFFQFILVFFFLLLLEQKTCFFSDHTLTHVKHYNNYNNSNLRTSYPFTKFFLPLFYSFILRLYNKLSCLFSAATFYPHSQVSQFMVEF